MCADDDDIKLRPERPTVVEKHLNGVSERLVWKKQSRVRVANFPELNDIS